MGSMIKCSKPPEGPAISRSGYGPVVNRPPRQGYTLVNCMASSDLTQDAPESSERGEDPVTSCLGKAGGVALEKQRGRTT